MKLDYLKVDNRKLRELIKMLKQKSSCSLRKIAECTNINRETIRKIYKE